MDRFLEKFNLPRQNQEEIEIMNNPVTSTEIEAVIKNPKKTKAQDQMASQENSIKHLEKNNVYPSKTLKKLHRKEHFQTDSTRPPSPRYQNQIKTTHKKRKLKANITDEHR